MFGDVNIFIFELNFPFKVNERKGLLHFWVIQFDVKVINFFDDVVKKEFLIGEKGEYLR